MRRALFIVNIFALLMAVACNKTSDNSPIAIMTDSAQVIVKAEIDFEQNGEVEKLYVRMIKGELKEENEPGPFQGTYWEGEFRLELIAKDGTLLHALDLNPTFDGGPLIFAQNRDFTIDFEDYNNDGYPDFSIGQYLSSNGFTYNLYSLKPGGIEVIHRDLFTSDGRYSILYEKAGNTSFKNRYYDMEKGEDVETLFTWQGDRFVRTECEGCQMPGAEAADNTLMNDTNIDWEKSEIKELEKTIETIESYYLNEDGEIGGWWVDYEQKKVIVLVKDLEVSKNKLNGIVNFDYIKFIEGEITIIDQSDH